MRPYSPTLHAHAGARSLKPTLRLLALPALLGLFPTCSVPPNDNEKGDPPALPDGGGGGKVVPPEPGNKPVTSVDGPVRFVVIGDTGKGNGSQRAVAAAINRKCSQS